MSFGPMIDDALGLALMFAMLSLVATTLMELVAAVLNLRGVLLLATLKRLTAGIPPITVNGTSLDVFAHPLVAAGAQSRSRSYVDPQSFVTALLDHLDLLDPDTTKAQIDAAIKKITDPTIQRTLQAYTTEAGNKIDALRQSLESWFNAAMDRVSGEYKRQSQMILFLIGLGTAVAFNADALGVAEKLWTDSSVRDAVVQQALQVKPPPAAGQTPDALIAALKADADPVKSLALPIGWGLSALPPPISKPSPSLFDRLARWVWPWGVLHVLGWIVTGFALCLGAPFWFDTLQKLINLRATGPKPGAAKKTH